MCVVRWIIRIDEWLYCWQVKIRAVSLHHIVLTDGFSRLIQWALGFSSYDGFIKFIWVELPKFFMNRFSSYTENLLYLQWSCVPTIVMEKTYPSAYNGHRRRSLLIKKERRLIRDLSQRCLSLLLPCLSLSQASKCANETPKEKRNMLNDKW